MIARIALFGAGIVAGVWAAMKARRLAYRLSTPGLVDQAASWKLGFAEFRKEFDDGMRARRVEQLNQLMESRPAMATRTPSITTLEEGSRGDI